MDRTKVCDFGHDKFVQIYEQKFKEPGEPFFQEQKALFLQELTSGSYAYMLSKASVFSIFNAFMSLAINGLSLEKSFTTLCYLECRSKKAGKNDKGQDIYQNMATITITGYGEVLMRQRAHQIRGIDNPVIVYDCDDFKFMERNGHKEVEYMKCMPRPVGAKLIACYVKINKIDGSYDYFCLDQDGMVRLRNYSLKFNGYKYTNPLYGKQQDCSDIDTGFLVSKTIKHAFKGYSKLPIGGGASLEADKDTDAPVPKDEKKEESFAPQHEAQGVKVDTSEDTPFNE